MVAVLSSFTLSFNMLNWRPEGGCERSPLHVLNQCFTSSLWHLPDRQVVDPQYLFCSQLPVQLAVPILCLASSEAGDCLQLYRCSDLSLLDVCHIGRWFGRDTTCWPLLHLSSGQQPLCCFPAAARCDSLPDYLPSLQHQVKTSQFEAWQILRLILPQ